MLNLLLSAVFNPVEYIPLPLEFSLDFVLQDSFPKPTFWTPLSLPLMTKRVL